MEVIPLNKIKEMIINLYYKVLTFLYKLFYKTLQFPTRNSINELGSNKLVITYMDYSIRDIQLLDDGLYHGRCMYKNTHYSLQGATLDLLVQDLIEGIKSKND